LSSQFFYARSSEILDSRACLPSFCNHLPRQAPKIWQSDHNWLNIDTTNLSPLPAAMCVIAHGAVSGSCPGYTLTWQSEGSSQINRML
jgi:hypothetical protein